MRSEFRFHRSTIVLMLIILAIIVVTIDKGKAIGGEWTFSWTPLITFVLMGFAWICLSGAVGYTVLFLLRRSGLHRLSNFAPWHDRK